MAVSLGWVLSGAALGAWVTFMDSYSLIAVGTGPQSLEISSRP